MMYYLIALDQLVSRIRKRLTSIGISPHVIKTIRTKGFMYLPNMHNMAGKENEVDRALISHATDLWNRGTLHQ